MKQKNYYLKKIFDSGHSRYDKLKSEKISKFYLNCEEKFFTGTSVSDLFD